MIKLKFKNKDKELEFFKSIEKLNYLDDACIRYAMMVSDNDEKNNIGLFTMEINRSE